MAFEFKYRLVGPAEPLIRAFDVAANQTIKTGDLVALSGGQVVKAASGATTILGVAQQGVTTGATVTSDVDTILVLIPKDSVFRVGYTGGTKTSLSNADIGTVFDITTDANGGHILNLDDTTGGMCRVWNFDNTKKTATVVLINQLF